MAKECIALGWMLGRQISRNDSFDQATSSRVRAPCQKQKTLRTLLQKTTEDKDIVEQQSRAVKSVQKEFTLHRNEDPVTAAMARTRSNATTDSGATGMTPQVSNVSEELGSTTQENSPRKRRKVQEDQQNPGSSLPVDNQQQSIPSPEASKTEQKVHGAEQVPPAPAVPLSDRFYPNTTEFHLNATRLEEGMLEIQQAIQTVIDGRMYEDGHPKGPKARFSLSTSRGGILQQLYKGLLGPQPPEEGMAKICKAVPSRHLVVAVAGRFFFEEVFAAAPVVDGNKEVASAKTALGMLEGGVESQLQSFGKS